MEDIINKMSQLGMQEESEILESYIASMQDSRFRVTNAGQMNPGKSTLFNALINKKDVFKTADVRLTTKNQEEILNDKIVLIDTPGCTSSDFNDENEAYQAFRQADLILFVLNLTTGGLNKAELAILKYIEKIFGKNDFAKRTVLVCSRIDEIGEDEEQNDETLKRNLSHIGNQLNENFYGELPLTCWVSPIYYFQGIDAKKKNKREEADFFINKSGLLELRKLIKDRCEVLGKKRTEQVDIVIQKLLTCKEEYDADLSLLNNAIQKSKNIARKSWSDTMANIEPAWKELA